MELIRTPKVENVRMLDRLSNLASGGATGTKPSTQGLLGTLYLTATHLIFVDRNDKQETWIVHSMFGSIEKLSTSTQGTPIHIRCKNFLSATFVIPKERDAYDSYTSLCSLSQPASVDDLYCFSYSASNEEFQTHRSIGWDKWDLLKEFARQGVPNSNWVLSTINKDYEMCDTYPRYLFVPSTATSTMLQGSSRFRSRGRLPVLSYLHKNGASLCRCSQPLSGFIARCLEDEQLLNCILKTNSSSDVLYVVDTRPRINAMANKAAGKGYENENFYDNIKFQFFGIENIHVMRASLLKLMDAGCELKVPSVNAFLSALDGSGWLRHIKSVLDAATFIANRIYEGVSIVVHCSDGWDRTAQTCSLASLLIDPYYRTIDGFEALIEKEWLSFGHKFNDRCGHNQTIDGKEIAPVFTQFIDCVYQIWSQFPFEFEFNEKFLLYLHDHVYSCQFGTFIGNCDRDRFYYRVKDRTYSLWAYLDAHKTELVNPLYETADVNRELLNLNTSPQIIRFWRMMYNRFDAGVHPRESIADLLVSTHNHITSLQEHIKYLEEKIADEMKKKESQRILQEARDYNVFDGTSVLTQGGDSDKDSVDLRKSEKDSFDSVDTPLRIVEECMARLQAKHDYKQQMLRQHLRNESDDEDDDEDSDEEEDDYEHVQEPVEKIVIVDPIKPNDDQRNEKIKEMGLSENSDISQIISDMESVALEWASFRFAKECVCSSPFDQSSRRFHCWSCGDVFCIRCADKKIVLPGHKYGLGGELDGNHEIAGQATAKSVPVCRSCYKNISRVTSFDMSCH